MREPHNPPNNMFVKKQKEALTSVLDTFSGADGGISFTRFRFFLEEIAKRADNKDKDAQEVLNILFKFEKLIQIANKK